MARLHRAGPARLRVAALALLASMAGACISPAKQPVYEDGGIEILLRSDSRFFRPIEKDYGHPVTIAPVRVAHILSRLDLRPPKGFVVSLEDEKDRVAAIQTEMLYSLGEGISKALAAATPDQEVVVMAIRDTKRWGVFDHDYLTSFVTYVRDDRLYVHLSRFEWEIPKRRDDRLPEPRVGDHPQRFRLYSGTAISLVNDQSVAIDWRDPIFARPTRTRILPGGDVVRREILMESPAEVDEIDDPVRRMPDDLSPQQLRDLADVEEDRREGRITETEYRIRRRRILEPDG
jgi:hypothetical protein